MKIIENGNEVIVRQYEISVNVCEFQKFKAGRIDRLTLRIEDKGGEMNLFKRVFLEETSGYGVLCIRCFHTLETICFMARAMSDDVVYRDTCKVSGPQKEVVFYSVYAVQIELLRVCESVSYKEIPGHDEPLKVFKVGNMNRLVKVAMKHWLKYQFIKEDGLEYNNLIYNRFTGEIANYPMFGYSSLSGWYRIVKDHYPVYYKDIYLGYVWNQDFNLCIPEGGFSADVFNGLCEALDGIHSTRQYRRS